MTSLIDQPDPNFGMDYRWCHFYPYRAEPAPGEAVRLELRLRNHLFKPAQVEIELKLPAGLSCEFPKRTLRLEGKTQAAVPFDIVRSGRRQLPDDGTDAAGKQTGPAAAVTSSPPTSQSTATGSANTPKRSSTDTAP